MGSRNKATPGPVSKKICGYAFLVFMNDDVPVLCMVQERDRAKAVAAILRSGRKKLDESGLKKATLIEGHRDDLFPEAVEDDLAQAPSIPGTSDRKWKI